VERRVEVGAGVRNHLDLADVELGARSVMRPGLLPAEEIADEGCRQILVGNHAVFDDMANIDQRG